MQIELLSSPTKATSQLTKLVTDCKAMAWAVAWATDNPLTRVALDRRDKFRHLVLGTNQFITAPSVIEQFMAHPTFRVQLPDAELFHPKVYCFDMGDHLAVMTGSHNLTGRAFSLNTEASVLMTGPCTDPHLVSFFRFVEKHWRTGSEVNADWLYGYKANHVRSKQLRKEAERWIDVKPSTAKKSLPGVQDMDWTRYLAEVTNDKIHGVDGRLLVLEKAGELLHGCSFADLSETDRKRIAGTRGRVRSKEGELDWGWFGAMGASPSFATTVMGNAEALASAMAAIPAEGGVEYADYERFVERFMAAFDQKLRAGGGIGTGTRLLAMKRPDQFVGLNDANRRGVCAHFGQAVNTTTLDNYWERIIEPMRLSVWWQAKEPSARQEQRIWKCRAAMLDAIHYVPKLSQAKRKPPIQSH
ncbi:UNVERIFIED_ORG: hypothetical protein ABIC43_002776 [Variovorax guangxiensis]